MIPNNPSQEPKTSSGFQPWQLIVLIVLTGLICTCIGYDVGKRSIPPDCTQQVLNDTLQMNQGEIPDSPQLGDEPGTAPTPEEIRKIWDSAYWRPTLDCPGLVTPILTIDSNVVLHDTLPYSFVSQTDTAEYDTVKIIAEVYQKAYKLTFGDHFVWTSDSTYRVIQDSVWSWDSSEVHTRKVLAWEVWRKDWRLVYVKSQYGGLGGYYDEQRLIPVEMVKRLAYNRKDELTHVLQTWQVEW